MDYLGFVDDVLDDMDGLLRYEDVLQMTYKEIGYLRKHHKKHHPKEANVISRALMGGAGKKK